METSDEVSGSPQWKDKPESEEAESAAAETPDENAEMEQESDSDYEEDESYEDEELPPPEVQKEKFTALANEIQMKEGDAWYLVHYRWWSQWKGYTGYKEAGYSYYYSAVTRQDEPPGEIDNSILLSPNSGELRRDISETRDFFLLDEKQWKLLVGWYGGGPDIQRNVIKTAGSYYSRAQFSVEIHLLRLHLVRSSDDTVKVLKLASKTMTCRELMNLGLAEFNLTEENTRMYDYHGDSRLKHLTDMDSILSEHQILDNQKIMFDEKGEDGKWPAPQRSTSHYSSSTYYGSSYSNTNYYDGTKQTTSPGLCGLRNLGNTCFMNSAIQCLSNSSKLRKFFLSKTYETDLNKDNPLGTGGELAEKFFELLGKVWGGEYSVAAPRDLKSKIEKNAPQFGGYSQHDSQELLMYLMDGIHEDCNRVKQKELVPTIESDGRPDAVVATEAWKGHLKRNNSVIVDLFQGQLKSTLVCPKCDRVSITFDPYMTLSVPIPIPKNRSMKIIMVWADPLKNPMKFRLDVPKGGKILDLKKELSKLVDLSEKELFVTEVYNSRFFKEFCDEDYLGPIRLGDKIYVHQIVAQPPLEEGEEEEEEEAPKPTATAPTYNYGASTMSSSIYGTGYYGASSYQTRPKKFPTGKPGKILHVRILNRKMNPKQLFGRPVVVSVPREVTYRELLRKIILRLQKHLDIDDPKVKAILEKTFSEEAGKQSARDADKEKDDKEESKEEEPAPQDPEDPKPMEDVDTDDEYDEDCGDLDECLFRMSVTNDMGSSEKKALVDTEEGAVLDPFKKDAAIFVTLEWPASSFDTFIDMPEFDEHESYHPAATTTTEQLSVKGCLDIFSKTETLSSDDSWYCSKCKEHVEASKQVEMYSVPENLIIHLKRFSYSTREKLGMLIDFPLEGLDLTNFLVNKEFDHEPIYDLYGVVNHFGSMGGGHYTAFAKHGPSGDWHNYDDSSVSKTSDTNICSESAYVLFYKRRDAWVGNSEIGNENENEEKEGQDHAEEENDEEEEETEKEGETEKEQEKEEEKEVEEEQPMENGDSDLEGGETPSDPNNRDWEGVETGLFT